MPWSDFLKNMRVEVFRNEDLVGHRLGLYELVVLGQVHNEFSLLSKCRRLKVLIFTPGYGLRPVVDGDAMAPPLCEDHVGGTLEFSYYSRVMHIHVDKLFLVYPTPWNNLF